VIEKNVENTLINKSISFQFNSSFFLLLFLKEIDSRARVFAEISRAVNTLVYSLKYHVR